MTASMPRALGLVAIWSAAAVPAVAQREPVLKQVAVPHAYYWREMYVPQVTSGPSAVTWSPDGTELIYSMQGSLWRQRIGSRVARQLATGDGYDYQPDWSPDGRLVVFARYAHDAIELQLLDLASGSVRPVTANGAVNVEPRWSPDGRRIAFVSSAYNRRWHIFTLEVDAGAAVEGTVTRLTEDNDSRLPRYYYSVWDHYLSPTWSPDGRELIIVANRGHIHGTGVAHDQRRRRCLSADLWGVRRDRAALVARRQAHRLHLKRRWEHRLVGDRPAGRPAASDRRLGAALPGARRPASDRGGGRRGAPARGAARGGQR